MKFVINCFAFFAAALGSHLVSGQTLTEKLIAEDPSQLLAQARVDGDIVRGAILFHQGNINCAKCHLPVAAQDRIGPDLSRLPADRTAEQLVVSILQPSKIIHPDFQTMKVATQDGRVLLGIVVNENAERIVIRSQPNFDLPIEIAKADIDALEKSSISSMPEKLIDELKDRRQFLDLLRYVIDIRERGPTRELVQSSEQSSRELSRELAGMILIQERNCVACHESQSWNPPIAPKRPPRLSWSTQQLNREYLERFLADPHGTKPGTTMPNLLENLNADAKREAVAALASFMSYQQENVYQFERPDTSAAKEGFITFQSVGCVACHAPRNEQAIEESLASSQPLGNLVPKYNLSALTEFLEEPLTVRPSGHMPNMQLTHREAVNVANFLLQGAEPSEATHSPPRPDADQVRRGERLFVELNCVRCHRDDLLATTPELPPIKSLSELRLDQGCLSNEPAQAPIFHLSDAERVSIQAALSQPSMEMSNQDRIDVTLQAFNCVACHGRNQLGGVSPERNPHFQTTNLNLGDQGRIPPTLSGVGAKLQAKWMRDVLVNHRSIRPYMLTRMPQFGEENIGGLVRLFEDSDQIDKVTFATFDDQEATRKYGTQLVGNQGLNCVACHTYQFKRSDTMPAVDLTEMAERLKKEWFYRYMLAPQDFSPNTVMPSFWPEGKGLRRDLAGTPADQIEALWQYLIDGRQANAPSGVVNERMEIGVANEAQMLRRQYPGIGKRGIGVGYPGGLNLAFDAEQLRLAMIWKGKFVDPGGVWTGQGSGNVRPLGQPIEFPKGPELDDAAKPWVVDEARPPQHQFKGYELDELQKPTFHYTFDGVDIKDFFTDVMGEGDTQGPWLRRTVKLQATESRSNLRFRIGADADIKASGDNIFQMGNRLTIRIISGPPARIVKPGTENSILEMPLDLGPNKSKELVIEYIWE